MATSSADIVNRALILIGGFNDNAPVTGTPPNFDGTNIGISAGVAYNACVQTVGRQFGWDFSRNVVSLVLSGNAAPLGFTFEYVYPTMGVEVRQVLPAVIADINNPLPANWTVGNASVTGTPTKVVWTNVASAVATFSNQPPEGTWDALFTEAVVRLLASELAMAIESKPDTARDVLTEGQEFEKMGETRNG